MFQSVAVHIVDKVSKGTSVAGQRQEQPGHQECWSKEFAVNMHNYIMKSWLHLYTASQSACWHTPDHVCLLGSCIWPVTWTQPLPLLKIGKPLQGRSQEKLKRIWIKTVANISEHYTTRVVNTCLSEELTLSSDSGTVCTGIGCQEMLGLNISCPSGG